MEIKTFEELKKLTELTHQKVYQVAEETEAKALEITVEEVRNRVKTHLVAMKNAIKRGLVSNEISISKMCGNDCEKLIKRYEKKSSLYSKTYQNIILYALATSEENLRMGKIVACPTAGSCGIVPAAITAVSEALNLKEEEQINALLTAGIIGKIISVKMALAGAVMGCQGECGVASAMAAGAIVELQEGNTDEIIHAATLAMKNIMGLVCDPVAGLVEVPCVKRNSFLAVHATVASELALAGIKSVIPPDEVIDAVKQVGELLSVSLKESSEAGLATTKTGKIIEENFQKQVL